MHISNNYHNTEPVKKIAKNKLRKLSQKTEGLILQGCAGDPHDWIDFMNRMWTKLNILQDGFNFMPKDCFVFVNDGVICIYFDIVNKPIDIMNLAIWRLRSREDFHGIWLSDYVEIKL